MLDAKIAAPNFGYIGYQPPQDALDTAKLVVGRLRARRTSRPPSCARSGSTIGYRLLELPPAADAAWHQIWQQFKAGA